MERGIKILLVLALMLSTAIFIQGCGHGDDANPYEAGITDSFDWESLEEGDEIYSTAGGISKASIDAVAYDMIRVVRELARDEGFNVGRTLPGFRGYSTIEYKDISFNMESEVSGDLEIHGDAVLVVSEIQRCAMFANLTIDYSLYIYGNKADEYHESKITNGSGEMRLMASSRGCAFGADMNMDLKIEGNIVVNGIKIEELELSNRYQTAANSVTEIYSATVDTPKGTLYCYPYSFGGVFCSDEDKRLYEYDDMTTCSDSVGAGHRECVLPLSSNFEGIWMYSGEEIPYEVPLKCSPDGIWSPPCPLDGSFDICPHGSTCSASTNVDWGSGLEEYGICTCSYR